MLNNASLIEVIYVAAMLIAFGAALANTFWSQARLSALRKSGENGVIELMRRGARNDQLKLMGICLGLVVIGVNALFAPPNPRTATATVLISGGAFIVLSLLVLWLSISIRRRPAQLRSADQVTSSDIPQ